MYDTLIHLEWPLASPFHSLVYNVACTFAGLSVSVYVCVRVCVCVCVCVCVHQDVGVMRLCEVYVCTAFE